MKTLKQNKYGMMIIALLILFGGAFNASGGGQNKPLVDDAAIEHLRETGEYDSLRAAFDEARNKDGDDESQRPEGSQTPLTASNGASSDNFGYSVAISGNTAIVGAWGANNNQGTAYIFVNINGSWTQQTPLTASDGAAGDAFGYSVAISGNTAIVGAYGKDIGANSNQGAAYIFVNNNGSWTQQSRLTASDGAQLDNFGISAAISGNTAIVGASGKDINGSVDQGAAYIFAGSGATWTQQPPLTASNGVAANAFGFSVAISGNIAIVGAWGANSNQGAAYVFVNNSGSWTQQTLLTASDGAAGDFFGSSVAISGNAVIVGAWGNDIGANSNQGAAYIFVGSGAMWTQQPPLTASNGAAGDNFGYSVAMGNTAIVGAPGDNVGPNINQGAAYVFVANGTQWTQQPPLTASDGAQLDAFGNSVAISGNTAIVGASGKDIGQNFNQGAAYIINLSNLRPPLFDFDGDGKTDISIFRPAPAEWWYLKSSTGGNGAFHFGTSTDKLVPGDYTGDGKTDIAFFRPSNGFWYVMRSQDNSFYSFPFGAGGDIPAPADYDGDGKTDAAVFRPSTVTWYISRSSGGTTIQQFGQTGDVPVAADYDGDGKADIAIYRASVGDWWIQRSTLGIIAFHFGHSPDKPVQGDYTGDGKADAAFWRPSTGEWFVLRSENMSYYSFPFGNSADIPAPGDYDGDGKLDAAVFRPSNNTWFVNKSTGGTLIQTFGNSGDKPVPNAFVP